MEEPVYCYTQEELVEALRSLPSRRYLYKPDRESWKWYSMMIREGHAAKVWIEPDGLVGVEV